MKNKYIYLTMAFALVVSAGHAQFADNKSITLRSVETGKQGNEANVSLMMDYSDLRLTPQEELIVTPMIINGRDTTGLDPVVFSGRKRARVESRKDRLYGTDPRQNDPLATFINRKVTLYRVHPDGTTLIDNTVPYEYSTEYRDWMQGSRVVMKQELIGCNNRHDQYYTYLADLYTPVSPKVVYVVPEPQPEIRTESLDAQIIFRQDHYDIDRSLASNDRELQLMYDMTERIHNNELNRVKGIKLVGVASPEAPYSYNSNLAENRVETVKNLLRDKYNIDESMFEVSTVPEDWDSVRVWVADSDMRYRNEVVRIIDETSDPDARDAKIRALDGGATYNQIYRNLYPVLRRTEYSIDYETGPRPIAELRKAAHTNPEDLSLNEMYMVIASYPMDSAEAEHAMVMTLAYFPDDVPCNNNMAAKALHRRDNETARKHLDRIASNSEAFNNLGVLHALEGRHDEAAEHFRQAIANGSEEAEHNLTYLVSLE